MLLKRFKLINNATPYYNLKNKKVNNNGTL